MRDGELKNKKFIKRKDAVAGVIEALLLVALVSIVISTIQLVYIPQTMEQRESDHMDDVANQFSYLKSVIDLQSLVKENVPISSPITLGSRELPYFVTAKAFGQLDIIYGGSTDSKIMTDSSADIPLTSIKYEAFNSYFVDQTYILEGGCIIVKQSDGETVIIEPSITVNNKSSENKIEIIYNIPVINGIAGKNSTNGYKNCFIRTNYSNQGTHSMALTSYIRIYTDYIDAWDASLNKLLKEEVENGYIIIEKFPIVSPDYVRIEPSGGKQLYVDLIATYIGAQIGPGIVIL